MKVAEAQSAPSVDLPRASSRKRSREAPAIPPKKSKARKRRRGRKSRGKETPSKHDAQRADLLFANRCFALSLNLKGEEDTAMSRKTMEAVIVKRGGKIVNTVNKRLFCLVASELAVETCTQRVRKAVKRGIAIVRPDFVHKCIEKSKILPLKEFAIASGDIQKSMERLRTRKIETSRKETTEVAPEESCYVRRIHIECACSCHDSNQESCSYCVTHHSND